MNNLLDTEDTKMGITLNVKSALTNWKNLGDNLIQTKKMRFGLDIEKIIEKRSESKIKKCMRLIPINIGKGCEEVLKDTGMNPAEKKEEKYTIKKREKNIFPEENSVGLLNQEKLFDLSCVRYVEIRKKRFTDTIMIIQNLMTLFGSVVRVTDTFTGKSITVRDLMIRLRKEMRKSELPTKAEEENPKRFSRLFNTQVMKSNRKQCITNDLWIQNLRSTGI